MQSLFAASSFTGGSANSASGASSLYPTGRPLQILIDGFRFGKTVGALGSGTAALRNAGIATSRDGVYVAQSVTDDFANDLKEGLRTFKFLDRFPVDH